MIQGDKNRTIKREEVRCVNGRKVPCMNPRQTMDDVVKTNATSVSFRDVELPAQTERERALSRPALLFV